jgi:hypothetical protein
MQLARGIIQQMFRIAACIIPTSCCSNRLTWLLVKNETRTTCRILCLYMLIY